MNEQTAVIILMGVSGAGKTTVGKALARDLGWRFYEGDNFHPQRNVAKMTEGIPLTDADRRPWLAALHDLISDTLARGESAVLTCSALKETYRQRLLAGNEGAVVVWLRGDYDLIRERLRERESHFMKAGMLQSQFEALEAPQEAIVVNVDGSVAEIVRKIRQRVGV